MNFKYFEHIVKHLPVVSACVLLGALARWAFINKGGDEYTANVVFWSITALSVFIFAIIILFLDGIIVVFRKIFPKKDSSKNSTVDFILTENRENIRKEQQKIINENTTIHLVENPTDHFIDALIETANVDVIRKAQLQNKLQKESDKLNIVLDYIRSQFALYASDEAIEALCNAVNLYSKKEEIPKNILVQTKELTNLDLYHFGWNIWNHFRPIKQEEISKLLKNLFVSLDDIDVESIKSHLKDEPKKGIIKILENLADYQKT